MTDDLDELLGPAPAPTDPAAKEVLFRRTARALARGRTVRRAAAAAAAALAFAAGAGVGWFGKSVPPAPPPELVPVPVPLPAPDSAAETGPAALAAAELELEAEKATDRAASARLFRQAGDKYLAEGTDIASATRCYASHLAEAGPAGLAVAADDSWLLIRLKASRTNANQETGHANAGT